MSDRPHLSDGERWRTGITAIGQDSIRFRGYAVDELMGSVNYASVVYLLIVGELPPPSVSRILDAILVSSVDHGTTPPSTLAARTAASTGASVNAAVAAGILSINRHHGGAIERCMEHLEDLYRIETGGAGSSTGRPCSVAEAARTLVDRAMAGGRRLSGFGHRVHEADPRVARLFEIAREEGVRDTWIARVRAVETALAQSSGRRLGINVDGAIAALLLELGLPRAVANGLFMIARMPGLLVHVLEEQSSQRPMRRIIPGAGDYDGPEDRELSGVEEESE